jgi:hypothetical protein
VNGITIDTFPDNSDISSHLFIIIFFSVFVISIYKENANVVLVDWEKGAENLLAYNQAAANCRVVGAIIARLMTSLQTSTGASFGNMYVIGHSLGAHIAGYAGEKINSLGRITGNYEQI